MNHLVSIIIPVYKVEAYIEKCMQSLLDQTYTNFEALIVDDGSPDNSIQLAKAKVGDDPRFIFFEKENGGQGTARNLALDNTKGDYIAFLDSDDTYTTNMLEISIDYLSNDSNTDILNFGINYVDEEGTLLHKVFHENNSLNTDKDILLLNKTTTNFFWDKVFRKSCISNHRFSTSIKTYEDVDLLYQVLFGCKITTIPNCLYNYTQRLGSTVYSLPPSYIHDKHHIVSNAKKFLINKSILQENEQYYNNYYLIEMYYKPLRLIAQYSKNYSRDISELTRVSDYKMLSIKNILKVKEHHGITVTISLFAFKVNKLLYLYLFKAWGLIRKGSIV